VSPFVLDCAVVIVNYRSPDLVSGCLESVAGERPGEVVVVDNASGDGSVGLLHDRHPDVRVIERRTNDGFAAGVNAGIAATSAPFVALLNPDTRVRAGALARLVDHLGANPHAGIAAPRLVYADGGLQANAYRRFPGLAMLFLDLCLPAGFIVQRFPRLDPYRVPPSELRDGLHVAHVSGAALALRRAAYAEAGALDEGFFLYLEETEWQQRVVRAGWTVDIVASAEVIHLVRGGGERSLAPSPHFLASARRYLGLRGHPRPVIEAMITASLLLSRAAARAERLVLPAARRTGGARAAAYDALWEARRTPERP
jgi:N-acetylglucosaminyl-diphospho-decaprenol L-rhamnosyltransferase